MKHRSFVSKTRSVFRTLQLIDILYFQNRLHGALLVLSKRVKSCQFPGGNR